MALRGRGAPLAIAALTVLIGLAAFVLSPLFQDLTTYGIHDWDVMAAHRLLAITAIRDGELPGTNPYACGGFPAWGYVEGATVVVSPLLPVYLWFDLRLALRLEVVFFVLLGMAGTLRLAGRFGASWGARVLAVVLFAFTSRVTLQAASGHTWHLVYALLPWALYAFERARKFPTRSRHVVLLAAVLALGVYWGGIYPLPHMALMLTLYATGHCLAGRSARPALALAASSGLALLLAAPKLLPILDTFGRAPRLIDSSETLSVGAFLRLLTARNQGFYDRPAEVSPYGFHEWGLYLSVAGAAVLAAAIALARTRRQRVLAGVSVLFLVLGFGAFSPVAPWTLLHRNVPVFSSQHVPSRFLYPAVLPAALVAVSLLCAALRKLGRHRRAAEWGVLAFAAILGLDLAVVARKPLGEAMVLVAPDIERAPTFTQQRRSTLQYVNRDWAMPLLLPTMRNQGVIECYGVPTFSPRGAAPQRSPRYAGESWLSDGRTLTLVGETTQSRSFVLDGGPAARLVLNLNFDASYRARVRGPEIDAVVEAHDHGGKVAFALPEHTQAVTVRYRPRGLGPGLLLAAAGATVAAVIARRERRGLPS